MIRQFCVLPLSVLFLAGCAATDPSTGTTRNTVISVEYGTVQRVEQVNLDAKTTSGALVGGGVGLLAASGGTGVQQAGAAAVGALIGAMIQKHRAGTGDRFTVLLNNGSTIQMITEHHDIAAGDCVSVEQGKHANIRRVSPVMCEASASSPGYAVMHAANVTESGECLAVKEELMAATTEAQADLAYKKMRAFCEQ